MEDEKDEDLTLAEPASEPIDNNPDDWIEASIYHNGKLKTVLCDPECWEVMSDGRIFTSVKVAN